MDAATVTGWADDFCGMWEQLGDCFARKDLRLRASAYVQGLLGNVPRKNSWQLAEHVGAQTPHAFQRLLGRASWDADTLRDQVRTYAANHLLDDASGGVLIIDETGFLKKGDKSAGVQRQYCGTAGRIENCQVGVFLALASSRGRALINRALYLPKSWCEDQPRRREAGVPPEVRFATKPQLALRMLRQALDAGLCPRWVLADAVYGCDSKTRGFLEDHGQAYVMAVTSQQRLRVDFKRQRVDAIIADVPNEQWQTHSIGEGAKGPRVYQWAGGKFGMPIEHERGNLQNWLLVRRPPDNVDDPTQRAYYFCAAPLDATLEDLAIAAGGRWAIKTCFQTAKQEVGLDAYEVRSWTGWHRHVTLSMLALAFLSVVRGQVREPTKKGALHWSR